MNPMQLIGMLKKGGNPQQMMINMLEQNAGNSPMGANLLALAKSGDTSSIEAIARNMCKEQGVDFDKEFANFRNTLGL